jgi:hypothetical protein
MPPRKKTAVAVQPLEQSTPVIEQQALPIEEPKVKRERKNAKHKVVAVVTPDGIQGIFQPDIRRPLIAHLPIHSNEIEFNDHTQFTYNPNPPPQPEAFNAGEIDPFASEATYEQIPHTKPDTVIEDEDESAVIEVKEPVVTSKQPSISVQQPMPRKEYGPTQLLVQFAETKQTQQLPESSDLACFWCCETFTDRPCVIPSHIQDEVWQVYGNFCMPQCAMAYLMSELLDTHTRWERIALLNRLYGAEMNGRIYPAPSRETLVRFGGSISCEEMRSLSRYQRLRVDIHLPPMVSILASMDTKPIDFYETPLRNTFASPHQLPIIRQSDEQQGLKLRRTKPLKDKESTLDSCLQITIK